MTGILSILVLQLAFTIFLKTSDVFAESDTLVRTASVALYPVGMTVGNSLAVLPAEYPAAKDVIGDQQFSITPPRFRAETASYRKNAIGRRLTTKKQFNRPAKTVPKVYFSDTIIEIGQTAAYRRPESTVDGMIVEERQYILPRSASYKTKTEKRSFVASVLPVVKKPYGWIKAIGSKIF